MPLLPCLVWPLHLLTLAPCRLGTHSSIWTPHTSRLFPHDRLDSTLPAHKQFAALASQGKPNKLLA